MNRDIIIVLICILIGYIGLKIYWKNKEHFTETLVKKPDAYNYYAKDEITEKPEIFDYENEMELVDKQQTQYNYHYVDDKIEMPNKTKKNETENNSRNKRLNGLSCVGPTNCLRFSTP